jgi:hypothetical protein
MITELSWQQFSTLPGMNTVSSHEVERRYRTYLNELAEQRMVIYQRQNAMGSGKIIQQEQSDLPSGCIEFVNNTSDGTNSRFWIETSAPTNYTITWGDGETTTGETTVGVGGGVGIGDGEDKLEINHSYADADTEYTVRICFDDITLVTYLDFLGDD